MDDRTLLRTAADRLDSLVARTTAGDWRTGVLLGLLTPWGLLRHWWVTVKLALTTAGAVLSLVVLTPALTALADGAGGSSPLAQRLELVRDSGAASVVLLVTLVLSVYKPFGRLRVEERDLDTVSA